MKGLGLEFRRVLFRSRTWPKLSRSTSTGQDLSYEPIPRSLQPSVAEKQPGKAHVSKNRYLWTFWPNSAISGDRIWPKLSKGTFSGQDLSFEPIHRSLRPSETAWKSSCFKKPLFMDISAKFGHCLWPNLAKTVKRHIYRPRPFI